MRKVATILLLSLLAAPSVQAAETFAGASYNMVSYDEDGLPSFDPTAVSLRFGAILSPNLAIEGRLGFGLSDDSKTVSGIPVTVEVDQYFGVYARGMLPINDSTSVYGLFGYTDGEIKGQVGGTPISSSESDFSFGFGADFSVSKQFGVNIEWAKLFSGDDFDVDALSIGLFIKF